MEFIKAFSQYLLTYGAEVVCQKLLCDMSITWVACHCFEVSIIPLLGPNVMPIKIPYWCSIILPSLPTWGILIYSPWPNSWCGMLIFKDQEKNLHIFSPMLSMTSQLTVKESAFNRISEKKKPLEFTMPEPINIILARPCIRALNICNALKLFNYKISRVLLITTY